MANVIAALVGSLITLAGTGCGQADVLMLCASLWLWKWQKPTLAEV